MIMSNMNHPDRPRSTSKRIQIIIFTYLKQCRRPVTIDRITLKITLNIVVYNTEVRSFSFLTAEIK